jgi:hypothetical protein
MTRDFRAHITLCLLALAGFVVGTAPAAAAWGPLDEVRLGVYQHDTGLIGTQKELGIDTQLEVLTRPLIPLSIVGAPRIAIGGVVNSAGYTDQIFAGFDGQWNFVHNVFTGGDAFFVEGFLGGCWHDGKKDVIGTAQEQYWKSHGGHFLFRTGFDFGYRFSPRWALGVSFYHVSNANIVKPNEGMNDIGLRLGMKL